MKNSMIKIAQKAVQMAAFAAAMSVSGAFASEDPFPEVVEVAAPVKVVFTPKGFDSNDNAEIVVHGSFPNSCYKMGPAQVQVNKETRVVEVSVKSYFNRQSMCLMVYVPFTQVVSLGVLKQGDYTVKVNERLEEMLPVHLASNDAKDDFLYATITNLSRKSKNVFQLQGILPSACSDLREVRVIQESGNVLAVLPIVKMQENCDESSGLVSPEFSVDFRIPADVKGQKLIHVRSMNGSSVNQVVEL